MLRVGDAQLGESRRDSYRYSPISFGLRLPARMVRNGMLPDRSQDNLRPIREWKRSSLPSIP